MHASEELLRAVVAATPGAPLRWRVQGLAGSAGAYFLYCLHRAHPRPALVVTAGTAEAERLASDLRFFFDESEESAPFARRVHAFPPWDAIPFEDISPAPETVAARIESLYHLRQSKQPVVVTTAAAVLQRVPPPSMFGGRWLHVVVGDEVDIDDLVQRLAAWGYRHLPVVEDRGEFSVRGGIIDVFPPAHPHPLRMELDGDVIATIRAFDRVTQRSLAQEQEILLLPVREFSPPSRSDRDLLHAVEDRCRELGVARAERTQMIHCLENGLLFPGGEFLLPYLHPRLVSLAEYLPPDTLVWVSNPGECGQALEAAEETVRRCAAERCAARQFYPPPEQLYQTAADWQAAVAGLARIEIGALELDAAGGRVIDVRCAGTQHLRLSARQVQREVSFEPVASRLRAWCEEGNRVLLVVTADAPAQRVTKFLAAYGLEAAIARGPVAAVLAAPAGRPRVLRGELSAGFRLPEEQLVVITETDLFGEIRHRRRTRPVQVGELLRDLSELRRDDHVVHVDHGVGLYRGLKHLHVAGTEGDYLHLEYAGGDRLYLPVDRIRLVQKYVGADGTAPPLNKLGSSGWERVKRKTRESILAMAGELLEVCAAREVTERRPYAAADDMFQEFEAAFAFEETPDQAKAVAETLADLARSKPMDRLVCGDVGFGKTEVAMRAAFLAVMAGCQVAVLVPTTVLAQQHLNTFRTRMEAYPIRIEMLSRFLTRAPAQEVVEGIRGGQVDIVIGTHRLLQKDIEFKRLGLLVVDEEHRFGVRHKERIKHLRRLVDVLTLTATPIPRTLQMSLVGIRDLSVIETPPVDRQAIRTYVTRYEEGLIREAILRELARGGQVFFVHNRVETIELVAQRVQTLVPEAKVAVAHGQLREGELEAVMLAFMEHRTDVLVCSAIVESGLDIPNANTMIINRADQFGLAQLYQLRGRVGRSYQRAYCYLMIPGEQLISKDAQKRLQVLHELDELGGGFRLAARDLEIRGAGNLLGRQQSGQVAAVGFELYEQMLAEAVRELRGEAVQPEIEPELQLGIPAFLPQSYVPDEHQRLRIYRRVAALRDEAELADVAAELRDRYGPAPPVVDRFLCLMDLRRCLREREVVRAVRRGEWVTLQFHPRAEVDGEILAAMVKGSAGRFRLAPDFQLRFRAQAEGQEEIITEVKDVLRRLGAS